MARNFPKRRGVTLTELLVVVTIIIIVTAVLVPMLSPILEGREVREAARQVNTYIQRARARALELGRPVGVVIRRSDSNPDIAYQLSLAEQPPTFTGFSDASRALVTSNNIAQLVMSTNSNTDALPESAEAMLLIQCNDYVRFNFRGPKYRILRKDIENRRIQFEVTFDQSPVHYPANQPLHYEVFRRPRQTAAMPLELPTGTALIMNLSGVGLDTTRLAVQPGHSPSIGMMEFQSLNIGEQEDVGSVQPDQMPPLTIMFNPNGEVQRIYRVFPPAMAGNCPPWMVLYPPKRPQAAIYLFLGKDGVFLNQQGVSDPRENLKDASNLWIRIDPRSGAITTAPNAVPSNVAVDSENIAAVVAQSRQLAASGQSVGGR
jgi:type II secretory pathway pseudopilin PulG